MRPILLVLIAVPLLTSVPAIAADPTGQAAEPIDLAPFGSSIRSFRMTFGRDHSYETYEADQYRAIADNLLAFQNDDGGWPKNIDWTAKLTPEQVRKMGQRPGRSTLDNRTTYTQIAYLAEAYRRSDDGRYRRAAERGLRYILDAQRDSGGWRGADVEAITFNDGVMAGVMTLLLDIRRGEARYAWIDGALRKRLAEALEAAIEVTLKCQVIVDGERTVWGQQHDHKTLAPIKARSFEPAGLTSAESVGVVRCLMKIQDPAPRIVDAIDAALDWFERTKIEGYRLAEVPLDEPVRFRYHTATHDRKLVADADAPPLWARFYDAKTNEPFFANRRGEKLDDYRDVPLERRTGYSWYGGYARSLLSRDAPAWRARIGDDARPPQD